MTRCSDKRAAKRAIWSDPQLVQLTVDLAAIAGSKFPPGDNKVSNGKSVLPS